MNMLQSGRDRQNFNKQPKQFTLKILNYYQWQKVQYPLRKTANPLQCNTIELQLWHTDFTHSDSNAHSRLILNWFVFPFKEPYSDCFNVMIMDISTYLKTTCQFQPDTFIILLVSLTIHPKNMPLATPLSALQSNKRTKITSI